MKNTIMIGDREVKLRASALTSFLYKKLFDKDLLAELSKIEQTNDISTMFGLAYVMNFQAESENPLNDMKKGLLTLDGFYSWLDGFEQMDLFNKDVVSVITSTWLGSQATTTNAKNHNRPQ